MTIEKLKASVYDRMVTIEQRQDEIKHLVSEIKQLNEQIAEAVQLAKDTELDVKEG